MAPAQSCSLQKQGVKHGLRRVQVGTGGGPGRQLGSRAASMSPASVGLETASVGLGWAWEGGPGSQHESCQHRSQGSQHGSPACTRLLCLLLESCSSCCCRPVGAPPRRGQELLPHQPKGSGAFQSWTFSPRRIDKGWGSSPGHSPSVVSQQSWKEAHIVCTAGCFSGRENVAAIGSQCPRVLSALGAGWIAPLPALFSLHCSSYNRHQCPSSGCTDDDDGDDDHRS